MDLIENIIRLNRRHQRVLKDRREAAARFERDGRMEPDALVELASIDKIVDFYGDRLEYRTRLGDGHRVIGYRAIRTVRLRARTSASFSVGENEIVATSRGLATTMVLTVVSRRRPLVLDFRSEATELVHEALELIERHLHQRHASSFDDDAPSFLSPLLVSRADEIAKLAALNSAGVLSDEEFAQEKARILNP